MRCSLLKVLSVCTSLHSPPAPPATGLTLTLYSVPASSSGSRVVVAGGDPWMATWLLHTVVQFLLYCTWYSEMVTFLCRAIQLTLRVGLPPLTSLDRDTPVTWEWAYRSRVCRELKRKKQIKHYFMMCGHGCGTVLLWPISYKPNFKWTVWLYYYVTLWCAICIWVGREECSFTTDIY